MILLLSDNPFTAQPQAPAFLHQFLAGACGWAVNGVCDDSCVPSHHFLLWILAPE
jgi:hypothetical protein